MWPDRRLIDLLGIEHPIIQSPMAGSVTPALVYAVSGAGGLGMFGSALSDLNQIRTDTDIVKQKTTAPFGLNFFCHAEPQYDPVRHENWRNTFAKYYSELGVDIAKADQGGPWPRFDEARCEAVLEYGRGVVSFHFGLPQQALIEKLRAGGCKILCSATTVDEAKYLEDHGVDVVIAQGNDAGGHRGMFLSNDITGQPGTMALVPQIADVVSVPVVAAGGIGDARGIAAAFALGASGVQMGTAFLLTTEANVSALHRAALRSSGAHSTALTNVFSGRPARAISNRLIEEVGPMADAPPDFPLPGGVFAPLRAAGEKIGSNDYSPLWSGQGLGLIREADAGDLVSALVQETFKHFARLGGR